MARSFRSGLSVSGPFVCRCLNSPTLPRFHHPVIEPDRRISRIRLSDKGSGFRPREGLRPRTEPSQAQLPKQVFVREPCRSPTLDLLLDA